MYRKYVSFNLKVPVIDHLSKLLILKKFSVDVPKKIIYVRQTIPSLSYFCKYYFYYFQIKPNQTTYL